AGQVHPLLADARVALPRGAHPDPDRAMDGLPVVEPERQLGLQGAQVAYIHRRMDLGQPLALQDAAQQRLRRRARLGGIDVEPVKERAGLGHARDVGGLLAPVERLEAVADGAQLLVEGGGQLTLLQALGLEHAEPQAPPERLLPDEGRGLRMGLLCHGVNIERGGPRREPLLWRRAPKRCARWVLSTGRKEKPKNRLPRSSMGGGTSLSDLSGVSRHKGREALWPQNRADRRPPLAGRQAITSQAGGNDRRLNGRSIPGASGAAWEGT